MHIKRIVSNLFSASLITVGVAVGILVIIFLNLVFNFKSFVYLTGATGANP